MADTWKDWLWDGARDIYEAILAHPFLAGLTDGTLPPERFTYFVAQDAAYLRDYSRALSVVASKALSHADTAMLASHSADTADVELTLHASLLPALDITTEELAAVPVSPTTRAYTSYLLSVAYGGTFAEGLATVLPCYWIYQRVGDALLAKGSPDKRYQLWIDTYGGEEYAQTVEEVLELADRVGTDLPGGEAWRTREHFVTTSPLRVDVLGRRLAPGVLARLRQPAPCPPSTTSRSRPPTSGAPGLLRRGARRARGSCASASSSTRRRTTPRRGGRLG